VGPTEYPVVRAIDNAPLTALWILQRMGVENMVEVFGLGMGSRGISKGECHSLSGGLVVVVMKVIGPLPG